MDVRRKGECACTYMCVCMWCVSMYEYYCVGEGLCVCVCVCVCMCASVRVCMPMCEDATCESKRL